MHIVNQKIEYISFIEPSVFFCEVDSRPLLGIIEGQYKQQEHIGYQLSFSDGFKPLFIPLENGWWCEETAKPYLDAIQQELNSFVVL